jgi:hypothetical protein
LVLAAAWLTHTACSPHPIPAGKTSGTALCKYLNKGAATSLYFSGIDRQEANPFVGKRWLQFSVYKGDNMVAPVDLTLVSRKSVSASASARLLPDAVQNWVLHWFVVFCSTVQHQPRAQACCS